MTDKFSTQADHASDVARGLYAVTPSDLELSPLPKALYIGGTGDVYVVAADDSAAVKFKAVPAGAILPVRAKKVTASTTATDIVALV